MILCNCSANQIYSICISILVEYLCKFCNLIGWAIARYQPLVCRALVVPCSNGSLFLQTFESGTFFQKMDNQIPEKNVQEAIYGFLN